VIVVHDLPDDVDVTALAKTLKTRCATGGTVKGRNVEIQGDHRETIEAVLQELGFRSKRAGG
jgi:translation initiation factor 1